MNSILTIDNQEKHDMKRKLLILAIISIALLLTVSVVLVQVQARPVDSDIVTSVVNAPIVPNGTVSGDFPDFVINFDTDMDPSVEGRTLLAGNEIRITMPEDFTVDGTPLAGDPFTVSPFDAWSWAVLLQGWPQVPIFTSWPPGDLSGDIHYTISLSGTHTMIITANQDLDGSLSFPSPPAPPDMTYPGIKQVHVLFAHLVNPAPGTYEISVESETGPNGETEYGVGEIEILPEIQPAIAFTSVYNGPGRPNAIYQTTTVGDFTQIPYHLLAWGADGQPLSGAQVLQNGPNTADIVVFDVDDNPIDVGDITVTAPAGAESILIGNYETPTEVINAPISGTPAAHMVVELLLGSEVGVYAIDFALDDGNTIQAFVEVVDRPLDSPGTRTWHGMDYDPINDIVYLSGGRNQGCPCIYYKDVWAYDTATMTWMQKDDFADTLPLSAEMDMSAYDTESEKLVILANGLHTDTVPLIYTPSTGQLIEGGTDNLPAYRFEPGLAYHPGADRIVMFGGTNFGDTFADTWTYDTNSDTWAELTTIGTPPSRARFAMDYDSDADKMIMYGGGTGFLFGGQILSDTWAFDITTSTWTEIVTTVAPQLVEQVNGAYDSQSQRFILYGMSAAGAYETWAFDYVAQTWSQMHTVDTMGEPDGPRAHHPGEMVYSPAMDRVLLYGGTINWNESPRASAEFWAYDFESNTWEMLTTPYMTYLSVLFQ
jgi:hypothetical protein